MPGPEDTLPGDEVYVGVAAANPYVGAALFIVNAFKKLAELSSEDPVQKSLEELREAIARLAELITELQRQVDELEIRQAADENRARMRRLADNSNEILDLVGELGIAENPQSRALIADKAMRRAAIFLDDVDVWNYTDVKVIPRYDGYGNEVPPPDIEIQTPDFKAFPTLPVYALAVMTWLLAIDASEMDLPSMHQRYGKDLERHVDAVAREGGGKQGISLPQQIQQRLEVSILASFNYAKDHVCEYSIVYRNHMDRTGKLIRTFDRRTEGRNDLCQADSGEAFGDYQDVLAEDPGLQVLASLEAMLRRMLMAGSMRTQYIGQFGATQDHSTSIFYAVTPAFDVHWWRQDMPSDNPTWLGPKPVANWKDYAQVHSGGDSELFGFLPDGLTLHWWKHRGRSDGSSLWEGPITLAQPGNESEWLDNRTIIPGGDGILYGIVLRHESHEGNLQWSRYRESTPGTRAFSPGVMVATGWGAFRTVFSTGHGTIYGVTHDGQLVWHRHKGYLDGSPTWEPSVPVGKGFDRYGRIFGTDNGFFYGMLPDGQVHAYYHSGWRTGVPGVQGPVKAGVDWRTYAAVVPVVYGLPPYEGIR